MSKKLWVIAAVTGLIVGTLAYLAWQHYETCAICSVKNFNAQTVRHFIESFGPWAIVVYVILYTINTFTPFFPPIFIMSLSAGALFGQVLGTVALTLGTLSGTSAVFFTARYLGAKYVKRFVKGKSEKWYNKLSQNGFFVLLPARLIGFPPFGVIDAICGLSKMRYIDFILATFIGAAPWIVTQVLLADRFANFNPKDPVLWTLLIAFVAMIVITGKIVKAKEKKGPQAY